MKKFYDPLEWLGQTSEISSSYTVVSISEDELDAIQDYRIARNLFDLERYVRKIEARDVDENFKSGETYEFVLSKVREVDLLVVAENRPQTGNPIIDGFCEPSLDAYAKRFSADGVPCGVARVEAEQELSPQSRKSA